MATGLSLTELLERIGHDGSEILWPELPEPQCRRAFHIQECLWAVRHDFAFTPLDVSPAMTPDGVRISEIKMDITNFVWQRQGVALGQGIRNRHAVAFWRTKFYDPNGLIYDFQNQTFTPQTYWVMSRF